MSADGTSWRLSLPCTRAEAEALAGEVPALDALDPRPVLMTSEPDPAAPEAWRLDAYFDHDPAADELTIVRGLAGGDEAGAVEEVPPADWTTLSQAGLEPIRAGRFMVHTPAHRIDRHEGVIPFVIDAGLAFGTGHHETTCGCLEMLDRLKAGGARFTDVVDVGTGTGLLAFAARALWGSARVIASDIDPISIGVARENADANAVPLGRGRGAVELAVAPGLDQRRLRARAPYDLIVANILAGPLIELAPVLGSALLPGGSLILAGLLAGQADKVRLAYRRQGLRLADRIDRGDWPTLRLVKRRTARHGIAVAAAAAGGWATDGR